MYIKSTSGTEVFKNEYQIHDSINGIPTIEMDYTRLELSHAEPIYFLSKNWNDRFAMILKEEESIGNSARVKFTGVHSFVYDFKASRIYDTYTQYFNLQNILNVVFEDTGYNFEISGDDSYYSEHFQNFGNKDKMSLFNQILDRWGLEYRVSGTTVYISSARGEDTTKQFRYRMNIENSKVNLDVSTGATYIRGFFGRKPEEHDEDQTDTSFEREMTHDLADVYGIRHAEPYSNQNITTVETADAYLKQRLEDTWKLSIEIDVIDLGADETVSVGDVVWAIDERLDLKFKTRVVELVSHYNADDEIYKQVAILGNQTMIHDMFANEVTAQDLVEEVEQSVNKQIEDSQAEFDNNFNQLRDEIAASGQSVLDEAIANIEAKDEAMREEFSVWSDDLEDLRSDYIASIQDMTGTIDGIGTNITNINDRVDNVFADVSDIQGFIGDTTTSLNEKLQNISLGFNERIDNINLNTRNILRGTSFDEPELLRFYNDAYIRQSDDPRSIRMGPSTGFNTTSFMFLDSIRIEADTNYYLVLEHRSLAVNELDYLQLQLEDGSFQTIFDADTGLEGLTNLERGTLDWHKSTIRINSPVTLEGRLRIGTRFNEGNTVRGWIDVRLPYLTNTANREWLPHPRDANQSIEEVTRRITELEDGRHELITRTEYDFDTGELEGTIRDISDTVDGYSSTIANHEEWFVTNGSNVLQTVDEVSSKVWNTDISNIGANLIPLSSNAWEDGSYWSGGGTDNPDTTRIRLKRENPIPVVEGDTYTISDESAYVTALNEIDIYQFEDGEYLGQSTWITIPRGGQRTFVAEGNQILLAIRPLSGFTMQKSRFEHLVNPIKIKLERGSQATPMMGFMSNVEQLANRVSTTVYGTDGLNSTVAQHVVEIGTIQGTVADAEGNASLALQTVEGFSNTVTSLSDSVNANVNLLPQTYNRWEQGEVSSTTGNNTSGGSNTRIRTKGHIPIENASSIYFSNSNNTYRIYVRFYDGNLNFLGNVSGSVWIQRNQSRSFSHNARYIRIVVARVDNGAISAGSFLHNMKLEIGDKRTESINAISQLEQRADAIEMTVQDVDLYGVIRQSDVSVEPSGVTIGSAYIGESQFASMFRVMPNAIEAISENINFRGNLNVFGQIAGISVEAVTSSFGEVYADYIEGGYSKVEYLEAFDAEVKRAFIKEASIEELFAHDATIRKLEAIDLTANQIRIAFNDISPNVQINNQSMEFYNGANRISRLDRFGSRFYETGVEVGQIGPAKMLNTSHRGLRFYLTDQSEYMSWEIANMDGVASEIKLIWSRGDSNWKEGFTFTDPVRLDTLIPRSATSDSERLFITSSTNFAPGRATVLQLNNTNDDSIPSGNIRGSSDIVFKPGSTYVRANAYGRVASLRITSNSTRNVMSSSVPYDFTTTDASNYLTMDSQWQFRRLTSSKKYKYHNKFIDTDTASKLLEINPATWFDKTAVDDYTNELNDNYDGIDKDEIEKKGYVKEKIKPVPGLYAEDVRDAGLEDFVTYNEDGEVDGINQNLWVLLIPLVKELKSEIKELKEQLK